MSKRPKFTQTGQQGGTFQHYEKEETAKDDIKQEESQDFSVNYDLDDGLNTANKEAQTRTDGELANYVLNPSDSSDVKLLKTRSKSVEFMTEFRRLNREKSIPNTLHSKEDSSDYENTTGKVSNYHKFKRAPPGIQRSKTLSANFHMKPLGEMAENMSTQGAVPQTAGLRGNRPQDAEFITYKKLQNYPPSRDYEVKKSDVLHGNGRDSGLSSEILPGENTRPSTSYSRNYGRQNTPFNADYLQQDSNVFVKNGILSANNEHLLQQIKDLEQDKLLARIEKQNSENRIMKLENDMSVMSRNYKRTIDNLSDQKNIEILKVQTRCKEENDKKMEDLRQRKEEELASEKTERTKEQIKYQNLFISKEALQNHYEEAVNREKVTKELLTQREAEHKEIIELKNKELGEAREEILNLRHQRDLEVRDHEASLKEMQQKHDHEINALILKHKQNLLQAEYENLMGRLDDQTVRRTSSKICTVS